MYSRPSTSKTCAPSALSTKMGWPPTARKARTGELTPPGMYRSASANSCSDFVVMEKLNKNSNFQVALRYGKTASDAKGLAGHLQARRGLATLVLVDVN